MPPIKSKNRRVLQADFHGAHLDRFLMPQPIHLNSQASDLRCLSEGSRQELWRSSCTALLALARSNRTLVLQVAKEGDRIVQREGRGGESL